MESDMLENCGPLFAASRYIEIRSRDRRSRTESLNEQLCELNA